MFQAIFFLIQKSLKDKKTSNKGYREQPKTQATTGGRWRKEGPWGQSG